MLQRTFINKEETGAPGFKAGRVRLLCANMVDKEWGMPEVNEHACTHNSSRCCCVAGTNTTL